MDRKEHEKKKGQRPRDEKGRFIKKIVEVDESQPSRRKKKEVPPPTKKRRMSKKRKIPSQRTMSANRPSPRQNTQRMTPPCLSRT